MVKDTGIRLVKRRCSGFWIRDWVGCRSGRVRLWRSEGSDGVIGRQRCWIKGRQWVGIVDHFNVTWVVRWMSILS
jgi:hypothetical protein